MEKIEYRVRPVTRFIVTRYAEETAMHGKTKVGSSTHGEFDRRSVANVTAAALAKNEADAPLPKEVDGCNMLFDRQIIYQLLDDNLVPADEVVLVG